MRTIYKYSLKVTDVQTIELPKNSLLLCVQIQNDEPQLWAEVVTEWETETRTIEIFGTGHPMPFIKEHHHRYISTFQMENGRLVFHAYERVPTNI